MSKRPLSPCALCYDQLASGDVTFRRETRSAEQLWVHISTSEVAPLCPGCYAWFQSVMQAAAQPDPAGRPPGAPWPSGAVGLDSHRCDFCGGAVRHEAYVVDFVPAAEDEMRNRIDRYHGSVCQYRLCEACWTWARATLDDDSAVTALGSRADEAEPGRWLLGHRFNVAAAGLLACDVSLLERTVGAAGRRTKVLGRAEAKGYRPPQGELMFVGTTGADQATQVVSRLAPDARERTVVVARFDATDDLGGALRAGALDFLVSPLTPQQVAGAFERHAQGPSELARDVTTGLPRRRSPGGRFGHPGHVLRLSRVPQSELLGTAWLLRRFLRGYDDVGLHDERTLEAVVYCPDAAAQAVASRLMAILSPGITVTVVERLAVQAQGGRLRRAA